MAKARLLQAPVGAPEVEIDYDELTEALKGKLAKTGELKPKSSSAAEEEIDTRLSAYREVHEQSLVGDWHRLFPNVPYSEDRARELLDDFFAQKRQEIMKELAEREKLLQVLQWIFPKWAFTFYVSTVASIFTVPSLLWLLLQPSNAAFFGGGIGLIVNAVVLVALFLKANQD